MSVEWSPAVTEACRSGYTSGPRAICVSLLPCALHLRLTKAESKALEGPVFGLGRPK